MKIILLLSFSLFSFNLANSQEVAMEWVKHFAGTENVVINSVITDDSGYVYVAGEFNNSLIIDKGGIDSLFNSSIKENFGRYYYGNTFVSKFDQCGSLIWFKRYEGISTFSSYLSDKVITIDEQGNLYAIGFCIIPSISNPHNMNFEPETNEYLYTNTTTKPKVYIFVTKHSDEGKILWVKLFDIISDVSDPRGIATDNKGHIYIAGSFRETSDFDPSPDTFFFTQKNKYTK